jgi:glycosyltransferase involved in cell wall biosynthesis
MLPAIRGIENLLELVDKDERLELDIAGTGSGLDSLVEKYANSNSRIHYHGKVDYDTALSLMNNSDFIVALYYLCASFHKYASPNKYYESLYLSKPVITSKGTLVGNEVEKYNTGYTIEDSLDSLINLFKDIDSHDFLLSYKAKVEACKNRWDTVYSNYFNNVTKGLYINMVKDLCK